MIHEEHENFTVRWDGTETLIGIHRPFKEPAHLAALISTLRSAHKRMSDFQAERAPDSVSEGQEKPVTKPYQSDEDEETYIHDNGTAQSATEFAAAHGLVPRTSNATSVCGACGKTYSDDCRFCNGSDPRASEAVCVECSEPMASPAPDWCRSCSHRRHAPHTNEASCEKCGAKIIPSHTLCYQCAAAPRVDNTSYTSSDFLAKVVDTERDPVREALHRIATWSCHDKARGFTVSDAKVLAAAVLHAYEKRTDYSKDTLSTEIRRHVSHACSCASTDECLSDIGNFVDAGRSESRPDDAPLGLRDRVYEVDPPNRNGTIVAWHGADEWEVDLDLSALVKTHTIIVVKNSKLRRLSEQRLNDASCTHCGNTGVDAWPVCLDPIDCQKRLLAGHRSAAPRVNKAITEEDAWKAYCAIHRTAEGPQGAAQRHAFSFAWANAHISVTSTVRESPPGEDAEGAKRLAAWFRGDDSPSKMTKPEVKK